MPYQITQLAPELLHVKMMGHVDQQAANAYYPEVCEILDQCESSVHIVMDAREVKSVCPVAREVVDKVRFHARVGIIVFVVKQRYLLIFSSVLQFFSGLRMFGDEQSAFAFLRGYTAKSAPGAVAAEVVASREAGIAGVCEPDQVAVVASASSSVAVSSPGAGRTPVVAEPAGQISPEEAEVPVLVESPAHTDIALELGGSSFRIPAAMSTPSASSTAKTGKSGWSLEQLPLIPVSSAPSRVSPEIVQFDQLDRKPAAAAPRSGGVGNPVVGIFSFLTDMVEGMTRNIEDVPG